MSKEDFDTLGRLVDRLDNATAALLLPLPPQIHIDGVRGIVESVRDELKAFVVSRSGENPWEFHP